MALYKHITMLGYFISALIGLLWLSGAGLLFAVILYPLTIILRGIGWYLVSRAYDKKILALVAFGVLLGGSLLYLFGLGIVPVPGFSDTLDVPKLRLLAEIWIIYSFIELISYLTMSKYAKIFIGSLISIVGIGIIGFFLQAPITKPQDFLPFALYAVPFLILSALCSAIGFLKLEAQ